MALLTQGYSAFTDLEPTIKFDVVHKKESIHCPYYLHLVTSEVLPPISAASSTQLDMMMMTCLGHCPYPLYPYPDAALNIQHPLLHFEQM